MRLFRALEISASGLTAERLRMDLIANNIANVDTTRTAEGGPYRRQRPLLQSRGDTSPFGRLVRLVTGRMGETGEGVRVVGISRDVRPPKLRYDPSHPDADVNGYVALPNVDIVTEMVDLITASRAYEANVTAADAAKSMALRALEIGRG